MPSHITKEAAFSITEGQKKRFSEEGFFITDVLFRESELESVRSEFEQVWQAEGRPSMSFFGRFHRRSEKCLAFCRHPVFRDLCGQLIGPDADLNFNQALVKAPEGGRAFTWHQDARYLITEPLDAVTCWVAVTPVNVSNGTLWVLPGRHREGLLPHERDAFGQWHCRVDESLKRPVELQAGQMLVFSRLLPHASGPNTTSALRMAYQIGFTPMQFRVIDSKGPVQLPRIPMLRKGHPV